MSISVYVEAVNRDSPSFGNTNITITEDDPQRYEYLKACEKFFKDAGRPEDATKFEQASRQKTTS